jgi:8-oxo-dGTP pyrophosphatase MutT (NUDIX family)
MLLIISFSISLMRNEVQAVVYRMHKSNPEFLLEKKYGRWRLLKGGVLPNETEEDALKRELGQELGMENAEIIGKVGDYKFYARGMHTYSAHAHYVSSYLVFASEEQIRISREIEAATWFPETEVMYKLRLRNEKQMFSLAVKKIKTISQAQPRRSPISAAGS